ncbi:hypothetical protein HanHA300_Chr13g0488371 [Helianthus annuus]|nr:hypothetical protein HanHA300_Chr13g0488371 [Helianthus annuus]KAJ0498259.1 hypothetical protein HanHA89_Chr13g0520531 [Helianthus annuus]KAJ0664262.1 hypothetical protein HanLR1_Chr13g0490391 [Helianthus annuus]
MNINIEFKGFMLPDFRRVGNRIMHKFKMQMLAGGFKPLMKLNENINLCNDIYKDHDDDDVEAISEC